MAQFVRQQRFLARARDTLERRVDERTTDLHRMIAHRDILLREVYYRVKNNLRVLDWPVQTEAWRATDRQAAECLGRLQNQVHALGLVHAQLMLSDDMESFDVAPFRREPVENLECALGGGGGGACHAR